LYGPVLNSIIIKKFDHTEMTLTKDNKLQYDASANNPLWANFTSYVIGNTIKGRKNIKNPPIWVLQMINDPKWR